MISLICANPVGAVTGRINPGMLTVDYAFHQFASRHFPRTDLGFFTLGSLPGYPADRFGLPFAYRDYQAAFGEVMESAAMVFWGDFLHARAYQRIDLKKRGVPVPVIRSHLFLEGGGPEIFRKVIAFGGCLICDSGVTAYDRGYRARAEAFFRQVPYVYMRDMVSDMKVRSLVGSYDRPYLGADCALLFDGDFALADAGARLPPSGNLGIFFGRTLLNMRHFFDLARKLAEREGRPLEWLHWLPLLEEGARFLDRHFPNVERGALPASMMELYAKLRSFDYILTDTYHLSLIAWRMGVPAVCIGEGAKRKETTLDDKKKETFYSTYGAEPFYLYAERFSDPAWRSATAEQLQRILHDPEITGQVRRNLLSHATWAEQTLKRCLEDVLKA